MGTPSYDSRIPVFIGTPPEIFPYFRVVTLPPSFPTIAKQQAAGPAGQPNGTSSCSSSVGKYFFREAGREIWLSWRSQAKATALPYTWKSKISRGCSRSEE